MEGGEARGPGEIVGVMPVHPTKAVVPALVATAGDHARRRFLEFFTANIRNPHTRRAYGRYGRTGSFSAAISGPDNDPMYRTACVPLTASS